MSRSIQCGCGARLKLPDDLPAGKRVKCPKCKVALEVPGMPAPAAQPTSKPTSKPAAASSPSKTGAHKPQPKQPAAPDLASAELIPINDPIAAPAQPGWNDPFGAAAPGPGAFGPGMVDPFGGQFPGAQHPGMPGGLLPQNPMPMQPMPMPMQQAIYAAQPVSPMGPTLGSNSGSSSGKPCPYCGESVLRNARKCKHCGEFLSGGGRTGDVLTPAEYIVATLFCPVGLIVGIVWAIQQKMVRAQKMMLISGLCNLILGLCLFGLWFHLFRARNLHGNQLRGVPISEAPDRDRSFQIEEEDSSSSQSGRLRSTPSSNPKVNLDGQPPTIQRAMKANVQIESSVSAGGVSIGMSLGSGVIVQREGELALVITNRHVIDQEYATSGGAQGAALEKIPAPKVTYFSEQTNAAKVKWLAPDMIDLAILEVTCPKEIEPVVFERSKVTIGEKLFAVGNPVGLGWTYTQGVASTMRTMEYGSNKRAVTIIQTDTKIAGGSSGGGLYNEGGILIGINTAQVDPRLGSGIGFAISIDTLAELQPQILRLTPAPAGATGAASAPPVGAQSPPVTITPQ